MARPREFDTRHALENAMGVFWTKGYEAASLAGLTRAMGISKSSLYETFGSKHELFLASIGLYSETMIGRLSGQLDAQVSARGAIESLFAMFIDEALGPDPRGCLLGNCASEVASHDPQAAARIAKGMGKLEDLFHRTVVRGQAAGEISGDHDARALARYLTCVANGLRVMGKVTPDRRALTDMKRLAMTALD